MPIDFASGFNRGGYDPTGFAGRARGGYFPSIYGYDDQGKQVNDRAQMSQINAQRNAIPSNSTGSIPSSAANPTADFFSQLAGLMSGGGQAGPASNPRQFGGTPYQNVAPGQESMAYAKTLPPAQYNDYMAKYGGRDAIAFAGQNAPRQNPMNQGTGRNGMARTQEQGGQPISMPYMPGSSYPSGNENIDNMPKPGRPMAAPARKPMAAPARKPMAAPNESVNTGTYGRAPGLMAGNSPALGEKNPLSGMPAPRRVAQSAGRSSRGRTAPSRANFNYQMGGNG